MGRNLDDIIKSLPTERQAKISALADQKANEMLAVAATLTDVRKAVGKTQTEVAKVLGIKQNAVSQLEQRTDIYVSTLHRFLKSLEMTLELSVINKHGERITLPNFLTTLYTELATNDAPTVVRTKKAIPVRPLGAKSSSTGRVYVGKKPAAKKPHSMKTVSTRGN